MLLEASLSLQDGRHSFNRESAMVGNRGSLRTPEVHSHKNATASLCTRDATTDGPERKQGEESQLLREAKFGKAEGNRSRTKIGLTLLWGAAQGLHDDARN